MRGSDNGLDQIILCMELGRSRKTWLLSLQCNSNESRPPELSRVDVCMSQKAQNGVQVGKGNEDARAKCSAFISVWKGRNVIDTHKTFKSYFNVKGGITGDFPHARYICCARTQWQRGSSLLWPRAGALWRGRGPWQRPLLAEDKTYVGN